MIEPKILAVGEFHPQDLEVSISTSNRAVAPEIEAQIERVWQNMLIEAERSGKKCYNGISYRLNSLEQQGSRIKLDFGTIEYKVRDGLIAIPEYFKLPESYYRKGCYTGATVKTSDRKYVMVELSGKSMNDNKTDLLGGIMETAIPLETGEDIFRSLYAELGEEAGIAKEEVSRVYLRAIYLSGRTNVGFYFEVELFLTTSDLLKRFARENADADIRSLKFFSREEYVHHLAQHQADSKRLTAELLNI